MMVVDALRRMPSDDSLMLTTMGAMRAALSPLAAPLELRVWAGSTNERTVGGAGGVEGWGIEGWS